MSYLQEAVAEYAWQHGKLNSDEAWILSPFDTWEPNPCYSGPPQRHPEDEGYYDGPYSPVPPGQVSNWEDDIPF